MKYLNLLRIAFTIFCRCVNNMKNFFEKKCIVSQYNIVFRSIVASKCIEIIVQEKIYGKSSI